MNPSPPPRHPHLACLVHWLELAANREQPPHLSNSMFAAVMIAFLLATAAWIAALMVAFRRPIDA